MEKIIFRSYLIFAKKEDLKLWIKLTKLPLKLKLLFSCAFISDVLMLITARGASALNGVFWITLLIALILVVILFYQVEFYIIERTEESYEEHKNYCEKLKKWLFDNWIRSEKEIKTIINRTKKIIAKEKKEREKFTSKIFDVFKILVIPIILLAVTSYVNNETDFITAFGNILGVNVIIIIFICYFGLVWNFFSAVKIMKVAQMERFVDDLQSVLDICFYKIYRGKAKEEIEEQRNE